MLYQCYTLAIVAPFTYNAGTVHIQCRNCLQTMPELFTDNAGTVYRQCRNCSQTMPELFTDNAGTVYRQYRNCLQTMPELFTDNAGTVHRQCRNCWELFIFLNAKNSSKPDPLRIRQNVRYRGDSYTEEVRFGRVALYIDIEVKCCLANRNIAESRLGVSTVLFSISVQTCQLLATFLVSQTRISTCTTVTLSIYQCRI